MRVLKRIWAAWGHYNNIAAIWGFDLRSALGGSLVLGLVAFFWGAVEGRSTGDVFLFAIAVMAAAAILIAAVGVAWKSWFDTTPRPENERAIGTTAGGGMFPDWTIRELFFHINPNVLELERKHYLEQDGWEVIGRDLLDKLSTGQLQAWGRLWTQTAGHPPLTPIPATFWGDADFTYDFFAAEHQYHQHAGPRRSRDGRGTWYADIRVNRAQALSIFPDIAPGVGDLIAGAKALRDNASRKLMYAEKVIAGERDKSTWLRKLDIQTIGFEIANLKDSPLLSRSQKTLLYELRIRNAELESTIASIIAKKNSDPHPHPAGMYANRVRGLLSALDALIEDLEGKRVR